MNRLVLAGGAGLLAVAVLALLAPALAPVDPLEQDLARRLAPPGAGHPLGCDQLGRDVLSRLLHGARLSLALGLAVAAAAAAAGTAVGLAAGLLGGRMGGALMAVTDVFLAVPALILAMAIAGALGPGLFHAGAAVAAVTWPGVARLVRAETLALRESDFVRAARAAGASPLRVALRHVLPHLLPPVAVRATFDVGAAILSVAGLSFIGFGAQPPAPEWGALVSEGRAWLATHPQVAAAPGVALLVTVLSANLLGDGLRDALDPRAARRSG